MDWRNITDSMRDMEGEIGAMSRAVNEEIQMAIGAVQVEDAKVMRRQTKWTVVLNVLAAIYLPMTLVTGVFKINLVEISSEATAPNRWSAVKAWGIVFGAAVGSVLVYVAAASLLMRCWRFFCLLLRLVRSYLHRVLSLVMFKIHYFCKEWWIYKKVKELPAWKQDTKRKMEQRDLFLMTRRRRGKTDIEPWDLEAQMRSQ